MSGSLSDCWSPAEAAQKVGGHRCLPCPDLLEMITLMPRAALSPAKPRYRQSSCWSPKTCGQQQQRIIFITSNDVSVNRVAFE